MTGNIDIIQAIEDQKLFGTLFKNQEIWTNWKVFLKAVFALPMDSNELAVYQEYTGRKKPPENQFNEIYAIVGRRGGKSFITAIIACYLAVFKDWTPYLSPGESGWIMVIASEKNQARVILGYVKAILNLPMFKNRVEKELTSEIQLKDQVIISIKTADYRSLRGFTVCAAILDELAFFRSEGANPAEEILTALRPATASIPGSMIIGISTPYSKSSPLYEAFRSTYGQEDLDCLVWKAPTRAMNPSIDQKIIDKALKKDYAAARAEYLAEFREDLETFLPTELIEAAMIPERWELPRIENIEYLAFIDPSGGRGTDSMTLAIAFKDPENEKIVLARLEEAIPPFNPDEVTQRFSSIILSYGCYRATSDRYAGEWVTRAFLENDVTIEHSNLNKSEIYLEFEPLIAQGQVELLDNPRLLNQLRGLERQTRSGGKDRVDHPQGLHDDCSNVVAGACVLAADYTLGRWDVIILG